jgi:hypothetical protein
MRVVANLIAILLILAGAVFALQGLRVLPSAVMYGKPEWVVIGAAMVVLGGMIVLWARLRSRRKPSDHSPL